MGKGKGSPEYYACRVKPGRIIFEVDGVSEEVARIALYKASAKLPIKQNLLGDKFLCQRKKKKKLTKDQATKKIQVLKKDLFNIRFKKINNQIDNPAQYNEIKKSIARLYTTIKNQK